jgi:HlyD family secretion protein
MNAWAPPNLTGRGCFSWLKLKSAGLPEGVVARNSRIAAVEIDIATKIAGRIKDILMDEGHFSGRGGKISLGVQR